MNGPAIFTFTLKVVPQTVKRLLERCGRTMDQVDYFVFHQANRFMLDHLRAKMKIPTERFAVCLEHCGNTVSSTIPIALDDARARRLVAPGDIVMLVGFGVGLSWAATMIEIPTAPFWTHAEASGPQPIAPHA
jgi:3-oxoacyl-[acyl-carrier-protein] synthase-3